MASIANLVRGTRRDFSEPFARAGTNVVRAAEPLGGCPGSQLPAQAILVCKHDGGQITHELTRRLNLTFVTPIVAVPPSTRLEGDQHAHR